MRKWPAIWVGVAGVTLILSANQRPTGFLESRKPRARIKKFSRILDWSQDTTICHRKKKYLDNIYANSSN